MKTSLDRFLFETEQLEQYIRFNESLGEIIKYTPSQSDSQELKEKLLNTKTIVNSLTFKKVFEYNSIIVSMYGFFEKFIEDILVAYLEKLCDYVQSYDSLPKIIKENHSILSAQLIQNLKLPKYEHENIPKIVSKLENCVNKNISDLNTIAFTDHSSNFRINSIAEFFSRIGITSIGTRIKNNTDFKKFLVQRLGSDLNIHQTEDSIIFIILGDLAQRRNDISHGANNGNAILNSSFFPEYFTFLRQFSKALLCVLADILLEFECKKYFKSAILVAIYNHNILCLDLTNIDLKIGSRIIVKSGSANNSSYFELLVEEIQIDNKPIDSITIGDDSTKVGLKLNGRVKMNQEFFVKKNKKSA